MLDLTKPILLDGAFGTELHKRILPPAEIPEQYNLIAPDAIRSINESYAKAGSDILYANTFGASPLKCAAHGLDSEELIEAAIRIAKDAAEATGAKVALDIGSSGMLMEPMGPLKFDDAYDAFATMIKAGAKAGADLIVIETMTDLYEVKAALLAAKENSSLPVFVTMTFEENGRTFAGASLESMVSLCESLGADAIGINCSLGPKQLAPLLAKLASLTALPVIAKPNAGLPDPKDGSYHLSDEEFVNAAKAFLDAGVSIAGGCCGTTPATIRALKAELKGRTIEKRTIEKPETLCTPTRTLTLDQVRIVGERINPTGKKRLQQALLENDLNYVARLAIEQQEAGADMLDVNVGYPGVDEVKMLPAAIRAIQSVCDLPLLLDSSNPKALEAGLRAVNGKAAINSVNGKQESMDAIFPLVQKYGTSVVALCLDEEGIPQTAKKRIEIAKKMLEESGKYGISKDRLWFDCLSLTISAQQDQAKETLKAIEVISREWGAPTILGVTNISFGLPERKLMNRTFLNAALQAGLRFAIINPSIADLTDTIHAFKVINGEDPGCRAYTQRYAPVQSDGASAPKNESTAKKEGYTLQEAIIKGLDADAADAAKRLMSEGMNELDIAENELIPALDVVGAGYEAGTLYLPSLLQAANAAQAVFEVLKESMANKGESSQSKGTIVLATVKGDVHDIGKNIVKTLLENYNFAVIDLGKDVAPEKILETVKEKNIQLVGLSALMTTTLPAMEETIKLLHTLENPPRIMVGGAVVTQEASDDMGADFYGKDARASVNYANEVFGR